MNSSFKNLCDDWCRMKRRLDSSDLHLSFSKGSRPVIVPESNVKLDVSHPTLFICSFKVSCELVPCAKWTQHGAAVVRQSPIGCRAQSGGCYAAASLYLACLRYGLDECEIAKSLIDCGYTSTITHSAAFSICDTFQAITERAPLGAPYSRRTDTSADAFRSSKHVRRRGTVAVPRS